MRLIIAGGRDFYSYEMLKQYTDAFIQRYAKDEEITIISGLARGADELGCDYAVERGYTIEGFAAEWGKYGRSAGVRRNKYMAKNADALIAFWDYNSKGTMHMIDFAHEKNLKVEVVKYV